MTQMIPEALPVRVDVTPVAYIDVVIEGPQGLKATLHIPDSEEVWDVLDEFVAAIPQAVTQGMDAALADPADVRSHHIEPNESDEAARAVEMQVPHA